MMALAVAVKALLARVVAAERERDYWAKESARWEAAWEKDHRDLIRNAERENA